MTEQLLQAIPHCCPSVPVVCCTILRLEKQNFDEKTEEKALPWIEIFVF